MNSVRSTKFNKTIQVTITKSVYTLKKSNLLEGLEVLVVMVEGRSLEAIGGSAGSLHTVGHARGPTREHSNLGKKEVFLLEVVKELVEVWTTEVGDGTQSSEQTLATQPLEVTLADVLEWRIHS